MKGRAAGEHTAPDHEAFADWARRLRRSDAGAFRSLFEATNTTLLRFAWRYTFDEEAARDVVQDVFLKLWQVRETLDDRKSLRSLLYTMVRNRSLNHRRARRDEDRPLGASASWEPEDPERLDERADARLLEKRLRLWIEELPERRREAFILSRYHGMTHEEIAALMGLTPRTVNTHIVLALKDLRGKLEALEPQRRA